MKTKGRVFEKAFQPRNVGFVLFMLFVSQPIVSFAQNGGSQVTAKITPRAKVADCGIPAAMAIEPDALARAAESLDVMPAIAEQTAAAMAGLDFQLAQLGPTLDGLSELRQGLSGFDEGPMTLAQSAAIAEMNVGLASLASSVPFAMTEAQDVIALGQESTVAAKAYEKAYNLVLSKKWTEAQKEFDSFIGKYPEQLIF